MKKILGNELQSMNEEIDSQTKQQVKLQDDIHEMEEAIQQLSENLDDLSEQMLRIDLKLSQGNNERIRLEQEYQRYKKATKQAKEKQRQQELER